MKQRLSGHDILYRCPPRTYRDAMPFGNGKFGGLCLRPSHWEWVINKLDVLHVDPWTDYSVTDNPFTGRMFTKTSIENSVRYAEILKAVKNKDADRLDRLRHDQIKKLPVQQIAGRRAGTIRWNPENMVPAILRVYPAGDGDAGRDFQQRLCLRAGMIRARVTERECSYTVNTVCDPEEDVFVANFQASQGRLPLEKIVLRRPPHDFFYETKPRFGCDKDCIWVDFELKNHFRYVVLVQIKGVSFRAKVHEEEVVASIAQPRGTMALSVTCATCLETEDPLQKCLQTVAASRVGDITRRNKQHWQRFWERSFVEIGDDYLENLYYFHQYAFACTHGNGAKAVHKAAGLYGLWTHTDWTVWANNVYGDVNIELTYQHVYSSNHLEFFEPFTRMVWSYFELARKRAREVFNLPGACFEAPLHCIGTWYCQMMWDYYAYSADLEYLGGKLYPIMKEVGMFYAAFLRRDKQGKYYLFGTMPPERGLDMPGADTQKTTMGFKNYCKNTTIDLALLKQLFKHLIASSRLLKTDLDMIPKWQDILDNFPEYATGKTSHGTTIFDMEEYGQPRMCHHPNTVMPVYPCREMHFSSPEATFQLAKATVRSCWENIRMFYTFNGPWVAIALARLGLGNEAERVLATQVVDLFSDPVGFLGREMNPYYTPYTPLRFGPRPGNAVLLETGSGFIAAINEMLVQEQDGTLFLFPAVPDTWNHARFKGLRVPGAFTVSSEYAKGKTLYVTIHAHKPGRLRLKNPWGTRMVHVSPSSGQSFTANGNIVELTFKADEEYHIAAPQRADANGKDKKTRTGHPKERITRQGFHLFLGQDRRSRVVEAIEKFCFPYMTFDEKGHIFEEQRPHGKFVEYPQNMFYKFDFGTVGKANYAACFAQARTGDCKFIPIRPKTNYSTLQRYGWEKSQRRECVKCPGEDPLSRTAIVGKEESAFLVDLESGDYQFLLLHGSGRRVRTRVEIPDVNATFILDGSNGDTGIESFGWRVFPERPVKIIFSTYPGYHWQAHALLVKKLW